MCVWLFLWQLSLYLIYETDKLNPLWFYRKAFQQVSLSSLKPLCLCFQMCGSVLAAVVGLLGSGYCFVMSGFALVQGPQCFTSYGWTYPFADQGGR